MTESALSTRLDTAWAEIKSGLMRGLSIGFAPVAGAVEAIKGGGVRYLRWTWLELSACVIPANAEATITAVKSAAAGRRTIKLITDTRGDVTRRTGGVQLIRAGRR